MLSYDMTGNKPRSRGCIYLVPIALPHRYFERAQPCATRHPVSDNGIHPVKRFVDSV